MTRANLVEVLEQPYIAAARARGEPNWRVIWVHGVRNIAMPLVTIVGLQLGALLQGAVLTETVFSLPGIGQMITNAVLNREYGIVQGRRDDHGVPVCHDEPSRRPRLSLPRSTPEPR